jgi:hypothetical protein
MILGTTLRSPDFFRWWVGYGGILYGLLSLILSARAGRGWLALTLVLWMAWWWDTATGYCRRCSHFQCGLHGAVMQRYFARDLTPLPRWRGAAHAAADLFMFAWPQRWFWSWPWLGASTIVWLALAIVAVHPHSEQARRDAAKHGGHRASSGVR